VNFWNLQYLIVYNLIMLGVDVGMVLSFRRWRTFRGWVITMTVGMVIGLFLTGFFSLKPGNPTLAGSCFLFGHLVLWFVASILLMWKTARSVVWISCVTGAILVAIGIEAFFIEPTDLQINRFTFTDERIERPIRLIVLADLQTDQIGPYEKRVFEEIIVLKPDVLLLAGDYLQVLPRDWKRVRDLLAEQLRKVAPKIPLGIYAIQGNADYYFPWEPLFEGLDVAADRNRHYYDVGGIDLTCLSGPDSFSTHTSLKRPNSDRYHIAMGHSPHFAMSDKIDADLLLAGHTHGGQVRLPWFRPPWSIPLLTGGWMPREWVAGLTKLDAGKMLIVSRGVGMERGNHARIRFLCRPELVVVDLVPSVEED
jgi:uncharacterized protein